MSATFQTLQQSPLMGVEHLVQIPNGVILLVPRWLQKDEHIYKYCKRANSWIEMINLGKYGDSSPVLSVDEAQFDSTSNKLYIAFSTGNVVTIDIDAEQWGAKSVFWTTTGREIDYPPHWTMDQCVLIGDHFHAVTERYRELNRWYYIVVHKLTGKIVQEPFAIDTYLDWVDQIVHLESRNSIVLFGDVGNVPAHCEYSLTTKEWTICDWGPSKFSTKAVVAPANTQYVVAFGGTDHMVESWPESDVIRIYDFKLKRCIEIEGACPGIDITAAELMRDRDREELMTFGFVNRCFKEPAFKNIKTFPRVLIQLIADCVVDEYVHLLSVSKGHYKANMDDILRQIEDQKTHPIATGQKTRNV